jgi:hypothetical protein
MAAPEGEGLSVNRDLQSDVKAVSAGHYLHIGLVLLAAGYAWQVHSVWVGFAVLIGLFIVIGASNIIIMALAPDSSDVYRWWLRISRWDWLVVAFVGIGVSGAKIVQL